MRVTKIPKYACEKSPECGVTEAARPEGLVEGFRLRYDTSVAAEIIASKYAFHLPIYRQQDLFAGSGWVPSRGTLPNIAEAAGDLLPPFIDSLRGEVLSSGLLGTDDTRVTLPLPAGDPVVDPNCPKSKRIAEVFAAARKEKKPSVTARLWAYQPAEKQCGSPLCGERVSNSPMIFVTFLAAERRATLFNKLLSQPATEAERVRLHGEPASGRPRSIPDRPPIQRHSSGRLLFGLSRTDAAQRFAHRPRRVSCSGTAASVDRCKLFDAKENHPLLASQFLALYRQLYDVEDRARDLSPAERLTLRESDSRPIWTRLCELLDGDMAQRVLPKDKIAEALNYVRNHREPLSQFLTDGRLPLDNNDVEQLMK